MRSRMHGCPPPAASHQDGPAEIILYYRITELEVSKQIIGLSLGDQVDWKVLSCLGALQENLKKALAFLCNSRI